MTAPTTVAEAISQECAALEELLLKKNAKYGSSATQPKRLFAKSDALEQIAVRLDDKLSRIDNMGGLVKVLTEGSDDGEDTVMDLIGYLVLARVAVALKSKAPDPQPPVVPDSKI